MSAEQKHKASPEDREDDDVSPKRLQTENAEESPAQDAAEASSQQNVSSAEKPDASNQPVNDAAARAQLRQDRFKALQQRQADSRTKNRAETAAERHRQSIDPSAMTALNRKRAIASQKLMKADATAAGEDFERKRAWDWTIDEAEKWDRRMEKKQRHREDVAFQDYRQDARKVYKRQLRDLGDVDMEAYERSKAEAVQKAAEAGMLEIVEGEDGELTAVDRDGVFYATKDSTIMGSRKIDKNKVDKLVGELKKAEDARMRKRKERGQEVDEGDVTYINEKNKQFNQKLARFYDKYTSEIRDSFERGTAI